MQALAAPAPHLDGDDVGQLLAAGQVIHDENSYARALVSLISYCAGEARGQVLAAALQATQVDEYEWDEDGANLMLQLLAMWSFISRSQSICSGVKAVARWALWRKVQA